ncbi:MAG TPA: hypothetical protein VFA84_02985 [Acidimicrobiales bacterium]|nr:hypothetical protein [Acidimicrobiales bacterium]
MLRAWRAVPIVVAALGVAAACSSSASRAAAPSTAPATTVGAAPGPSGTASSGTASTSAPPTTATTAAPTTTAAPARVDPFTQPCDLLSADDLHALYPDLPAGQSQVSQQPLGAACAYGTPQHGVAFTLEKPTGDLSSTLAASAPGQGYAKATTAGGDVFVNASATRVLFVAKAVYVHFQVSPGAPRDAVVTLAGKLAAAITASE